jgi:hypothetical protein
MLMPISSEFITLCRSQVSLLTQAVGASLSVVYITQELEEGSPAQLVPIAVYPDTSIDLQELDIPSLPSSGFPLTAFQASLISKALPQSRQAGDPNLGESGEFVEKSKDKSNLLPSEIPPPSQPTVGQASLLDQRQVVMPLVHEEVMMGVLVTQRTDRAWTAWEETQVQEVAKSIAIACVLDQRYQWMERERQQEHRLRMQQHDMIDNLLHQFRNSLTALQTFGKLVLKRLSPGDRTRDIATNMVREATRLKELSDQLELITGISPPQQLALPPAAEDDLTPRTQSLNNPQTSTLPLLPTAGFLVSASLPLERCLVDVMIEPLLASAKTLAEGKGQTVHTQIPEDLPPIWANAQALREVLNNLLENAVKYTPENGHIFITVRVDESEIENRLEDQVSWLDIAITDTGFGIPPEDLSRLFERHYRGIQAQGAIPGSGLGLAIAKTLVDQMHGTIQAISPVALNRVGLANYAPLFINQPGTTFVVQLAIAIDPATSDL